MTNRPQIDASNIADTVKAVARYIEQEVFGARAVRVGFSEKRLSEEFGPRLITSYVVVPNETHNVHNYPLSIAGWALAEGRIIAWPQEQSASCDFDRIAALGKLEELDRLVKDDRLINAPPYLARIADVDSLKRAFIERTLELHDFYQDWSGWSPVSRYTQFISVPVPILENIHDPLETREFGVFNIDTFESSPLLSSSTEGPLAYASELVADAYRRFGGPDMAHLGL